MNAGKRDVRRRKKGLEIGVWGINFFLIVVLKR